MNGFENLIEWEKKAIKERPIIAKQKLVELEIKKKEIEKYLEELNGRKDRKTC